MLQAREAGEVEAVLKQGAKEDHTAWVKANTQLVRRISNSRLGTAHLTYLLETDRANNPDKLFNAIIEAAPEHKEKIMTVAQQLRQEGRQAGIELGIAKGILTGMERGMERGMEKRTLDIARNMLQEGSEPSFVGRVTGLPIDSIQGLQKA